MPQHGVQLLLEGADNGYTLHGFPFLHVQHNQLHNEYFLNSAYETVPGFILTGLGHKYESINFIQALTTFDSSQICLGCQKDPLHPKKEVILLKAASIHLCRDYGRRRFERRCFDTTDSCGLSRPCFFTNDHDVARRSHYHRRCLSRRLHLRRLVTAVFLGPFIPSLNTISTL